MNQDQDAILDDHAKRGGKRFYEVVWQDDNQIAVILAQRAWGDRPEVRVRVAQLDARKEVQC